MSLLCFLFFKFKEREVKILSIVTVWLQGKLQSKLLWYSKLSTYSCHLMRILIKPHKVEYIQKFKQPMINKANGKVTHLMILEIPKKRISTLTWYIYHNNCKSNHQAYLAPFAVYDLDKCILAKENVLQLHWL